MRTRRGKSGLSLVAIGIGVILAIGHQHGWFGSATTTTKTATSTNGNRVQTGMYPINHFIDGDTIAVTISGKSQAVRFIGIDTPETHKPNTPVQCYGAAAAAYTQNRIKAAGSIVKLVSDTTGSDHDKYGRLVRYVYLPDGTNLNEVLVQNGYAFYYPYFSFSMKSQFAADEKSAQAAKLGLWGACTPTPSDGGGYVMNEVAT